MPICESAAVCGQLDKHPTEKELQELGKKKQKAKGGLKIRIIRKRNCKIFRKETVKSFEACIHDILIRINANKYLTGNNKSQERIILADILKRYYNNKVPDSAERKRDIWQTIINKRSMMDLNRSSEL